MEFWGRKCRLLNYVGLSVTAFSVSLASASPQASTSFTMANIFPIWQVPMSQLWLRDGEPPTRGKIQPPKFRSALEQLEGIRSQWKSATPSSICHHRGLVDGKNSRIVTAPRLKFPLRPPGSRDESNCRWCSMKKQSCGRDHVRIEKGE